MTAEGPADVGGTQEDSNRTKKATLPTKGVRATRGGKSFQYVCPHCDQSVTRTISTGQVNHRRTCGHRFQVKDGRVFAKAYEYVCPACNGHVTSNVATGKIDHRPIRGKIFCEGWCCAREGFCLPVPILQRQCKKRCQDRAHQPSIHVRQSVSCQGRCNQQGNTVSCAQLPGLLNCCLVTAVTWANCGHA